MFFLSKILLHLPVTSVPQRRTSANSHASVSRISMLPSPCRPGTFSARRQRSSLQLLAEAGRRFGHEGPWLGAVLLAMAWLLPRAMGFTEGPLCKATGWRLWSVVCLPSGVTNGYSGFPKLPAISGHLDSKRFVNKSMYSLRRLGSCFRDRAHLDAGLHLE